MLIPTLHPSLIKDLTINPLGVESTLDLPIYMLGLLGSVAKIVYPCDSPSIVESKSIKLYFNSYNMYKCGGSPKEVLQFISSRAEEDLSRLLETHVSVHVEQARADTTGDSIFIDDRYTTLELLLNTGDLAGMTVDTYQESPDLLEVVKVDSIGRKKILSR